MELRWGLSVNKWSDVKCSSDMGWSGVINVKWLCFEVKWVTVKFLGTKVPCTLGWPYTEGTWLYWDNFIWCVSCTVVVFNCFVMCGCVYVWVFLNCVGVLVIRVMCTCIYGVFLMFVLCFWTVSLYIFILFCFVCTCVRTTATEWQLSWSK
jgi:hypothetical protein